MGVNPGHKGKFTLGTNPVANVTSVEWDGITHRLDNATTLLAEFEKMEYGVANGGKITVNGWFDITDTNGQNALTAASVGKTKLAVATSNDPRIYINATSYLKLSTNPVGEALIESGPKIGPVDTKSGLVPFSFVLQISNGYLTLNA